MQCQVILKGGSSVACRQGSQTRVLIVFSCSERSDIVLLESFLNFLEIDTGVISIRFDYHISVFNRGFRHCF